MKFNRFAKGRTVRRKPGEMNKLEASYAMKLKLDQTMGQILWYQFDAIKLRLADKTFYTPDFFVMTKDGDLEVHEVKGFWEDDARVKIKVAADKFPFKFIAISQKRKEWIIEEF